MVDGEKDYSKSLEENGNRKNCDETRKARQKVRPRGRRRVFWTVAEENMLRKGVAKYARDDRKNIPWLKIWRLRKYGKCVFHESRMPEHLKDKWRRMAKGNLAYTL